MAILAELLSGSTNGRPIVVVATGTPGTLIHTVHATALDELWLWANNTDTSPRKLTIELGGVTAPDDLIEIRLAPEDGLHLVVPGVRLTGSVVIRAFAATANVVTLCGNVNRYS